MMPKMNPRQMESVMRRMGISQVEIPAKEVIIRCDDRIITINNPSVTKVKMMGADTFQIGGEVSESAISAEPEISDDDVDLVVAQTGASKEVAQKALKKNEGDIAKTILELKPQT